MATINSVNSNNLNTLTSVEGGNTQRIFMSSLPSSNGSFLTISGTAYFTYLGRTVANITPKFIEVYLAAATAAGSQTSEIGIFSTPSAPNKAAQTLSKLVSTGTVDNVVGTIGMIRNTSAFATVIPAGTHIWAGCRFVMGTTQPAFNSVFSDLSEGSILVTAGASALTGAGTWAGALVTINTSGVNLRATLD